MIVNKIINRKLLEYLIILLVMIFIMLCSEKLCLSVLFSLSYRYTLDERRIFPCLGLFSIIFDLYTGRFCGTTCCMSLTIYLVAKRYINSLRNMSIAWRSYYFLITLIYAETVGVGISCLFRKHIELLAHLVEMMYAIILFIVLECTRKIIENAKTK